MLVLIDTKLIIGTTGVIFFEGNVWTRGYDKELCEPGPAFDPPRSVGPIMELPESKGAVYFFFSTIYFRQYNSVRTCASVYNSMAISKFC